MCTYTVRKKTRARIVNWGFSHDGKRKVFCLGVVVERHPKLNAYNTADWRK